MCLAVVALDTHPHYSVVLAANRDEFHERAAIPAAWGDDPPFANILAGRDLAAGGTWLGVSRDCRWALVTNVRDGTTADPHARSRGYLVPRVLNSALPPSSVIDSVMTSPGTYNGFNLLYGNTAQMVWASNRGKQSRIVARGIHGLSNAGLDTPWPKVVRTLALLETWVHAADRDTEPLFAALGDRAPADDHLLPSTGVSREWERRLSAAFIVGEKYGTRCSTVLAIDRSGNARLQERRFHADGSPSGSVTHTFARG